MASIKRPWPLVLAFSLLGMISCSSGNQTKTDAGMQDSAVSDAGSDADADGDEDAGIDAGHDGGCGDCGCAGGGGVQACTSDHDCGGVAARCACSKLFSDQEITSYCYPTCSPGSPCVPSNLTCARQDDAGAGLCLATGYNEHAWKGTFQHGEVPSSSDITMDKLPFKVGSLDITFTMSVLSRGNSSTGSLVYIIYVASGETSQFELHVIVPANMFMPGNTVDFSECIALGQSCGATVIEYFVQGTTISQAFVRAVSIVDLAGTYENWVKIDIANQAVGPLSNGSWKLFFAEYNAEILP